MKAFFRYIWAWVVSVIVCVIVASFISTQRVIGGLIDVGGDVSLSERLSMTFYDVTHFGTLYGIFVLVAFLVAFMAGAIIYRLAKTGRVIVYISAGAIAMFLMLMAMQMVFFGVPIVAGARDNAGLVLQMTAGALGGYVFHKITSEQADKII